jgi:hypothetical protein
VSLNKKRSEITSESESESEREKSERGGKERIEK